MPKINHCPLRAINGIHELGRQLPSVNYSLKWSIYTVQTATVLCAEHDRFLKLDWRAPITLIFTISHSHRQLVKMLTRKPGSL